jgi:RNA polymerase sigma-70 factor (ECF subfamily)
MGWFLTLLWRGLRAVPHPRADEADVVLVARMASRDHASMAKLYDLHGRAVFSLALRIVRDQADAEDVTQDVFAQAWRQAERYDRARGAVGAWLLNMARSRAIDRLRTRRGAAVVSTDDATMPAGHLASDAPAPDVIVEYGARAARVREALDALPFLQRAALELAYFEGMSQSEIAARLEQPLGTVKTRMRLGLMKLREALMGTV